MDNIPLFLYRLAFIDRSTRFCSSESEKGINEGSWSTRIPMGVGGITAIYLELNTEHLGDSFEFFCVSVRTTIVLLTIVLTTTKKEA